MDVTKLPNIMQSVETEKYQVGEFLFLGFKDIPPTAGIKYSYALLIVSLRTQQPVLCFTAETMSKAYLELLRGSITDAIGEQDADSVINDDNPFFCITDENNNHRNLGASENWKDQKRFFTEAKKLAMERLNLNPQLHPTITKSSALSERTDHRSLIFGILAIIAPVIAYLIYSSSESEEQKKFMLQCLSQRSEAFCERLWEKRQES